MENSLPETIAFRPPDALPNQPEERYSFTQCKVLYLISKYASPAASVEENEIWIRQLSLLVLLYEGIITNHFDLDYAPASILVSYNGRSSRKWLNITREGQSILNELREAKLVNCLRLSTIDYQSTAAYQISFKGQKLVDQIPSNLKDEIDSYIYAPKPNAPHLLHVAFDNEHFFLHGGLYSRRSKITEIEDVSYVCSPYLPNSLRLITNTNSTTTAMTSNKHRAAECATGSSNIQDEFSEAVVLGYVHAIIGEWVPFGANQIIGLNERLGVQDRCSGGFFSSLIDTNPTMTHFEVAPGLTNVKVLDYDVTRHINFEAVINFPEEEGIVQVENFGMHLNVQGALMYGCKIEAIMDRQENDISLDYLSRLLVDVHQDSSKIIDDILSPYQISLLDMIYAGDLEQRLKYNMILAKEIRPKLKAIDYLDKSKFENEFQQVLGDLYTAYDITSEDFLILGRNGCFYSGPNIEKYEVILTCYMSLYCRDLFIKAFYNRTMVLSEQLKVIYQLCETSQKKPNTLTKIEELLNTVSQETVLLQEILEYLIDSIDLLVLTELDSTSKELQALKVFLRLDHLRYEIITRSKDSIKLIDGIKLQIDVLNQVIKYLHMSQMGGIFKKVDQNTKELLNTTKQYQQINTALQVMQLIFAGTFAFDIIDRLSGGSLNIPNPVWFINGIVKPIIQTPFLFFILNLVWLGVVVYCTLRYQNYLKVQQNRHVHLFLQINRRINCAKLYSYLKTKRLAIKETFSSNKITYRQLGWNEKFSELEEYLATHMKKSRSKEEIQHEKEFFEKLRKLQVEIDILIDEKFSFLLTLRVSVQGILPSELKENELLRILTDIFIQEEIYITSTNPYNQAIKGPTLTLIPE